MARPHSLIARAEAEALDATVPGEPGLGRPAPEESTCPAWYAGGPEHGPFGEGSGRPEAAPVEGLHALRRRQTSGALLHPEDREGRVNLPNRDGKDRPDGLFGRERGGHVRGSADERAVVWQAASLLLCYPDQALYEQRPMLREAVATRAVGPAAQRLTAFLDHLEAVPLGRLAEHYVETFDLRRRCCLYLTYYRDGDTRRRGESLAGLKARYRAAGMALDTRELPDHLPVVLEFAALHGGEDLLVEHRAGLELLRNALLDRGTPYVAPVEAVCATLPGPSPRARAEALKLAQTGPPREDVGLEPSGAGAPG